MKSLREKLEKIYQELVAIEEALLLDPSSNPAHRGVYQSNPQAFGDPTYFLTGDGKFVGKSNETQLLGKNIRFIAVKILNDLQKPDAIRADGFVSYGRGGWVTKDNSIWIGGGMEGHPPFIENGFYWGVKQPEIKGVATKVLYFGGRLDYINPLIAKDMERIVTALLASRKV